MSAFANKNSSLFPEYTQVYTDGSVKGSNIWAGVCIPYVSLNISETIPSHASNFVSRTICHSKKTGIYGQPQTCFKISVNYLWFEVCHPNNQKINYEAAESDLKSLGGSLLSLMKANTSICFHHILSHKGFTHNMTANQGINACIPSPSDSFKLGNLGGGVQHQ